MTDDRLAGLGEDQLIERFAELALCTGLAVLDSNTTTANRTLSRLWAIEDTLKSRGREARLHRVPLLGHKDRFVRYYAAQALLGVAPERARAVIEWNQSTNLMQ